MPDLDAAEQFLAAHARIVERRWFARAFRDGDPEPVVDAVRAYRNPDGGLGHGLEPDGRGPESQPAAALLGLTVLDAADAWDDEVVHGVCDWFAAVATDGGAPFVMPGVEAWPHAPWWVAQPGLPPSLTGTGPSLAILLRRGVRHPWVADATDWVLEALGAAGELHHYDLGGAMAVLGALPRDPRAATALERLAPQIRGTAGTADDGGDVHDAVRLAGRPDHPAIGTILDPARIAADLDELAAGQQADGGWTVGFPEWSPVAMTAWRGVATVDALTTLRAFGRAV